MKLSQQLLAVILLWSFAVGAMLGAIWDVFRVIRVAMSVENTEDLPRFYRRLLNVCAFAEDILFSVIAAVGVTIFVYHTNDGKFRWFALAGCALGFYIYYKTIGRLVISIAKPLTALIRRIIAFICVKIIFPPFRFCAVMLARLSRLLFKASKALFVNIFNLIRRRVIISRIKNEARRKRASAVSKRRSSNITNRGEEKKHCAKEA